VGRVPIADLNKLLGSIGATGRRFTAELHEVRSCCSSSGCSGGCSNKVCRLKTGIEELK
jgi:hypothetical protein